MYSTYKQTGHSENPQKSRKNLKTYKMETPSKAFIVWFVKQQRNTPKDSLEFFFQILEEDPDVLINTILSGLQKSQELASKALKKHIEIELTKDFAKHVVYGMRNYYLKEKKRA